MITGGYGLDYTRTLSVSDFYVDGTSTPGSCDEITMIIYAPTLPIDIIDVVKKKPPNFTRFQNDFKRRGRK